MLPSVPKTLGRLSDVLTSAASAVLGEANPLQLAKTSSAVVILVDGLGWQNLRGAGGHARFLNSLAERTKAVNTVLPTTTAAALTSLATGLQPNEHGVIGYRVFDRGTGRDHNLLSGWSGFSESDGWRNGLTVSQKLAVEGRSMFFVGPAAYERSGFTNIIMPAATYVPADLIAARFKAALNLLTTESSLVYLYIPELDQTAHANGVDSDKWLGLLEELDGIVREFAGKLPKAAGALITADHGIVDVPQTAHINLEHAGVDEIRHYGGDTRCGYLYLESGADADAARSLLQQYCGSAVTVVTPPELVASGWMKPYASSAERLAPDLVLLANKDVAVYHRDFSSRKSYSMVGHHGSWSAAELQIPILRFGAWV